MKIGTKAAVDRLNQGVEVIAFNAHKRRYLLEVQGNYLQLSFKSQFGNDAVRIRRSGNNAGDLEKALERMKKLTAF